MARKKKSYWSTRSRTSKSNYRGSHGYAAKHTDTNIQQVQDRVSALFAEAKARVDARLKAQKEQGEQKASDTPRAGSNLPALDFDGQDDPQAEGEAYLSRIERGLSTRWSDSKLF